MKRRLFTALLAASLLLTVYLPSCARKQSSRSVTLFDYFNTFSTLTAYARTNEEFERYKSIFSDTLAQYHSLLDATEEVEGKKNIHYLNKHAAHMPVEVADEMIDFLVFAKDAHTLTRGYTSITLGALTSIWKEALEAKALPDKLSLNEAAKHTDIDSLHIDAENRTVSFSDEHLALDAGALAKGYVSDIIYKRLIEAGCESFLINLGGNITSHGTKSDGQNWLAGIEDPYDIENVANISIILSERSISTSGSYNQFFMINGKTYHHIIDPYTAYPSNEFVSVSVITHDVANADALSTALFSMDKEMGLELIESLEDTEAIWITEAGEHFTSSGFNNYKK